MMQAATLNESMLSFWSVCVTVGLHRFDGVHLSVAPLNLRAQRLHLGHQLCHLKTGNGCMFHQLMGCF